jgi:uncharacterized protein (TIGR03435 family)
MQFHRETPMTQVYALVVGKGGPKLKEALPDAPGWKDGNKTTGSGDDQVTTMTGEGYRTTIANGRLLYEYASMTTKALAIFLNSFRLPLPIVDMTELQWSYQITIDISASDLPRPPQLAVPSDGASEPA